MSCPRAGELLGAYVLGALDPADRAVAEEHLAVCPRCAAEAADLGAVVGHLSVVQPVDLRPAPPPPELFDRIAAAADRHEGHGRRRRRWLAAAAAAVLLTAGGATWAATWDGADVRTATDGVVRLSVRATDAAEGTALAVRVTGLPAQQRCLLVVVDDDQEEHVAWDWVPSDSQRVTWDGWTPVERSDIEGMVLYGGTEELVRVDFDGDGA